MAYFGENLPIYREFEGGMLVVERLETVIDFGCAEDLRELCSQRCEATAPGTVR